MAKSSQAVTPPNRVDEVLAEHDRLKAEDPDRSQTVIAKQIGISQGYLSKILKTRSIAQLTSGAPASVPGSEPDGEPDGEPRSKPISEPISTPVGEPISAPDSTPDESIQESKPVHSGSLHSAPMTALQRIEHIGEPESTPTGEPSARFQHELDALKERVSTLEASLEAIKTQPAFLSGLPAQLTDGAPPPTTKRGFVITCELSEAIDRFAAQHRLQIRSVLDQALREFFAHHGWPEEEVRS
jgi:hypothetical protein